MQLHTPVDQFFSRVIIGYCDIIFNSGEDNYLTTDDAFENAHTVLASQLINEQFAVLANVKEEQMGLGHAFEMDPDIENGFLYELAQAIMAREIFPNAPLKYMPPTKYMTGNIFKGNVQDALFNIIAIWSGQSLQLLGMLTEAIHTPHMHDRYLSIENAQYIFNNMRDLPGLTHRYPDRVLFLITDQCSMYCRHCTRRRLAGETDGARSMEDINACIDYIKRTPVVRDVLLSGGDALCVETDVLEYIISELRKIDHVEIVRIGSRTPVVMPQRITDELVDMLKKYHPIWLNTHFNHPKEFTPESAEACRKLADAGIPLGNQSVLLRGVNDDVHVMRTCELRQPALRRNERPLRTF